MPGSFLESLAERSDSKSEFQAFSITTATVMSGIDETGEMRVQVQIPGLPDVTPWVRVALPMAGSQRGTFFIPQEGDEVLLAFNQGDIRESYVIGSVWNGIDKPPFTVPKDAVNKRLIRSPKGLELLFDDGIPSITLRIKSGDKQKLSAQSANQANAAKNGGGQAGGTAPVITLEPNRIVLKRVSGANQDNAVQSIVLDDNGITIEATKGDVVIKAPQGQVRIESRGFKQQSSSTVEMKAATTFSITGQTVNIN